MHPFFEVSILQGPPDPDPVRVDWDLQRTLKPSMWAMPCFMFSSLGVALLSSGFHKFLSFTLTTFAVVPTWMFLTVATTIACCPCHLVIVTSTLAVGKVGHVPGDRCCSLYVVHLRTLVFLQIRMISFLSSFAVLP